MSETALLPRPEVLARWERANAASAASLGAPLVLAFLGPASSGKDAAIKALFGVDFGQIDPIPGSTDRAKLITLHQRGAGELVVVNAPGFGDLRAGVEAEARRVMAEMDLAIYLVNCDGGATADERDDLAALRALGRPVLVCLNKIDLIRPHQREVFVRTTLAQLGVAAEDAVVTAFDPLPVLAPGPIGLDEVVGWIHRTLSERGKGLAFARFVRSKEAATDALIRAAAKKAAVAGAIPVPGADMAAVTAVQVSLLADLAQVFGVRLENDVVYFILGEVLAGSSKGFVRWGVGALKAAGWIPGTQLVELATSALGASLASAATWGLGKAAVAFLARRAAGAADLSGDELRAVFDAEAFQYKDAPRE